MSEQPEMMWQGVDGDGDHIAVSDDGFRFRVWLGVRGGELREQHDALLKEHILRAAFLAERARATAEASVRGAALRFLAAKAEKGGAMMLGGDVIACHNAAMAAARVLRDACAALTAAGGVVDEVTAEVLRETEAKE